MSDVYQAPPPPPPPPPATPAAPAFDFVRPFAFTFEDPRWLQKVLLGGLFYLLGIFLVGLFFVFGYLARLARNVIAGAAQPLPEWDDLGEYFGEGLRIFCVILVWMLPAMAMALFVIPAGFLSESGDEVMRNAGGCLLGTAWCLMFPLILAITFFLPASLLRVATERRFGAAFEFDEIWPFIRRNIGNYLLALVVLVVARFLAGFGVFLLCIGVIFTAFWAMLVSVYAFAQAYRMDSLRPEASGLRPRETV